MTDNITFFKEYFDFMDDMTPEEFYEFMGLIRDLRFNGVDTKPEEVENKTIRLAWRCIRPTIIKSTRNARDYEKRKKDGNNKEADNRPIPNCDLEPIPTFKTEDEIIAYASNIDMALGYDAAIKEIEKVCERNQIDSKPIKKEYKLMREQLLYDESYNMINK